MAKTGKKSLLEQINKDREPMELDKVDAMLHPEKMAQAEARARKGTDRQMPEPKKEYKIQPRQKEARSRRLQLLLTPSLYGKVERKAKQLGISVNELINTVLEDVIER